MLLLSILRRTVWRLVLFFCVGLFVSFIFIGQGETQNKKDCIDIPSNGDAIEKNRRISVLLQADSLIQKGAFDEAAKLQQTVKKQIGRASCRERV